MVLLDLLHNDFFCPSFCRSFYLFFLSFSSGLSFTPILRVQLLIIVILDSFRCRDGAALAVGEEDANGSLPSPLDDYFVNPLRLSFVSSFCVLVR